MKKWRRGYKIRPPPTSSYSPFYPGNDERRTKHFDDIRFSFRESLSRSLERRQIVLHRKFPKTESLKDCMDRSIPFYTDEIFQQCVKKGKRVLITSHENAIRGILKYLCDIPEEAMNQVSQPCPELSQSCNGSELTNPNELVHHWPCSSIYPTAYLLFTMSRESASQY